MCVSAVRCAPLLQSRSGTCAAGARDARLVHPKNAPHVPAGLAVREIVQNFKNYTINSHSNAGKAHCCAQKVQIAAIFAQSNVPFPPLTAQVVTNARTDGDRRGCSPVDEVPIGPHVALISPGSD